jgi:[ribosomal protein S18]-alanine N-acetyltransferase
MTTISDPTTKRLRIRAMKEEDLDQAKTIDRMSFSLPWPDHSYEYEFYKNPLSLLWVAEVEEKEEKHRVVGTLVIWLIVDEAHIATIAVHPEYRNQGIAGQMLAEAMRAAVDKGMLQATLEVRANNTFAQQLYKRFGFEIVGRRQRYYRDNNEDAFIMTVRNLNQTYLEWMDRALSNRAQELSALEHIKHEK